MVICLTLLVSTIFSLFFFAIDLRYFSLLPLFVAGTVIVYNLKKVNIDLHFIKGNFNQYSLYLIRCVLMIGLSWLLFFLWLSEITTLFSLILLNVGLWLISYGINYQDGKLLFEVWTYLLMGILIFSYFFQFWPLSAWYVLAQCIAFLFCVFWIFVGLFRKRVELPERYLYQFVIFWIYGLVIILFTVFHFEEVWFLSSFLLFSLLYCRIKWIQTWNFPKQESLNISVRRILAGERINKKVEVSQWKVALQKWILWTPVWGKYALEIPNLLFLLVIEGIYFYGLINHTVGISSLFYWICVIVFLINCYLLKKNEFVSKISRFALAFVFNLSVYSALLTWWSEHLGSILPFLILWTIFCQISLFYLDRLPKYFNKQDYYYWTIVSCISSVINVVLFFHLELSNQFLFSLVVFYSGIELFILYYLVKYLKKSDQDESLPSDDVL